MSSTGNDQSEMLQGHRKRYFCETGSELPRIEECGLEWLQKYEQHESCSSGQRMPIIEENDTAI